MTTGSPDLIRYFRRKAAQEWGRLSALIGTPNAFGNIAAGGSSAGSLTLPANAKFRAAVDAALSEADVTINIGGRAYNNHATGAADIVWNAGVGWAGELMTVDRAVGAPAGALTIYAVRDTGEEVEIANAVFT